VKKTIKSNIRETSVNKLALFDILMQSIIDGDKIASERACLAKSEIKEMLTWLERRAGSPRSVRKQALDKLKSFENILKQITENKSVSIAEAETAIKDVGQITNWLGKRKYNTFTGAQFFGKT